MIMIFQKALPDYVPDITHYILTAGVDDLCS